MLKISVSHVFLTKHPISPLTVALFLLEISIFLRNIYETLKTGFDKILRNIHAESREFVSCIEKNYNNL